MSVPNGSTVLTGHGGKVMTKEIGGTYKLVARLSQWSITQTRTEHAWSDSDAEGATNRVGGRRDLTGSIAGKLDKEHPAYNDVLFNVDETDPNNNDMVILLLWQDANETTPGEYWYLPRALITQFTMSMDVDTKAPVDWSANFGTDGVFYKPRESGTVASSGLITETFRDLPSAV